MKKLQPGFVEQREQRIVAQVPAVINVGDADRNSGGKRAVRHRKF
jgi:hypothetical protein